MMRRPLATVHGHNMADLENLLQDACDLFDDDVSLARDSLGGWSNINIRGHSTGIDFVLKLPWTRSSHDISLYSHLSDISHFYNKLGIAPLPVSMGQLSDTLETPFIIFEYIDGVTHDTLTEFNPQEINLLKQTFQILSDQNPQGLKRYRSPSDHLTRAYALVENHESIYSSSQAVAVLVDSFNELYPEVLSYTDSLGVWKPTIMHGDMWAPNIVLQSEKAVLLDFEACAYGSWLYDFAYLLETPITESVDIFGGLLSPEDARDVNHLRPLVVAFHAIWSLERILSMEAGLVEPNLSEMETKYAIIGYVSSKIRQLKAKLS